MNRSEDFAPLPVEAPSASPHAHGGARVGRTMALVCLALTPATLFAFWAFGWPAVHLWWITVSGAVFGELFCLKLARRPVKPALGDGSAVLTGWLLALSLPPWAPWWIGVAGGLIATVFAKQVFGGLGQNPFNPAMVARVALLISFPVPMTFWVAPLPMHLAEAPGFVDGLRITLGAVPLPDALASATVLGFTKTELSRGLDLVQAFAAGHAPASPWHGLHAGSLGETSALLILAGGLFLIVKGVIGWHIPLAVLAAIGLPALLFHLIDPGRYLPASSHLLSGATMLGAFFIATDYVTSPNTRLGQILFAVGIGLLTFVIRTWGGYPEGMAFAVLLMNAMTPVIDRYVRPRILGRTAAGKPLEPVGKEA